MIVIGYQGIGKSTLSKNIEMFSIDLESGNFWVNGKREENWYIVYCNIANSISNQGYIVCVSSHKVVRDFLKNSKEKIVLIFPSIELKDEWIKKLKNRYCETGLEKDYKAFKNALLYYDENIKELMESPFEKIIIDSMDYDLSKLIEDFK